jgi:hypothetical protein
VVTVRDGIVMQQRGVQRAAALRCTSWHAVAAQAPFHKTARLPPRLDLRFDSIVMNHSAFHELVSGDRAYKLSTLADIVDTAYRAGIPPRDEHLFPAFDNHIAALPRLLRVAYEHGLEPSDRHFGAMGSQVCPCKLVVLATSQQLADAHGRGRRYAMSWDLHVRDRPSVQRAELLAVAYASGDIALDYTLHLAPLGAYLTWRALAAAYAAGLPVSAEHTFELVGDLTAARVYCPARQRPCVAPVLLAWIAAGYAKRLECLPVQWVTSMSQRARTLRELYARNCVPARRHLTDYGVPCEPTVKRARRRYARAAAMQRKCLVKYLHSDLADVVYRMIRAADL